MVLQSGDVKYSSIAKVTIGSGAAGFTIYPNPVENGEVNLVLTNEPSGKYGIRVLNAAGQLIYVNTIEHAGGSRTEMISLPRKVSAGIYTLELSSPTGGTEKHKLIIKN